MIGITVGKTECIPSPFHFQSDTSKAPGFLQGSLTQVTKNKYFMPFDANIAMIGIINVKICVGITKKNISYLKSFDITSSPPCLWVLISALYRI